MGTRGAVSSATHRLVLWSVYLAFGLWSLTLYTIIYPHERGVPQYSMLICVLSGTYFIVALWRWRQYWFMPSDLVGALSNRGATDVVHRLYSYPEISLRIGDVWVLATFDNPVLDGLTPIPRFNMDGWLEAKRTPFSVEYMLRRSWVDFFVLGEFARFPRVSLRGFESVSNPSTGSGELDRAISLAARELIDQEMLVELEVAERWLRVEVRGGTWLGAKFGERVRQTDRFVQALRRGLSGSFVPLDCDEWQVTVRKLKFDVVPRKRKGSFGMRRIRTAV